MLSLAIEHLLRDHRDIERLIVELESLLDSQKSAARWTAEHCRAFARITRGYAERVALHSRKEDEVLYPALEGFLPRDIGPLAVLRGEQHDLCAHFNRMREAGEALCQGNNQSQARESFQRYGRATLQSLRDHIYKQDRILFPMASRFLSGVRDAYLLQQMEAMTPAKAISPPPADQGS